MLEMQKNEILSSVFLFFSHFQYRNSDRSVQQMFMTFKSIHATLDSRFQDNISTGTKEIQRLQGHLHLLGKCKVLF